MFAVKKLTYLIILSVFFISCENNLGNNDNNKGVTSTTKNENQYNDLFCSKVKGKREVRHYYRNDKYILVDCETDEYVYEGGKDKRSSLDSIQQAVFFSVVTGKKPAVVIYDTDDYFGEHEYRIQAVAEKLGIRFINE